MKQHGRLVLVLPDKEFTFDHYRSITTLTHLIEDYKNNITELDETHFEEVIALHDFKHDAFVQSKEELIKREKYHETRMCATEILGGRHRRTETG